MSDTQDQQTIEDAASQTGETTAIAEYTTTAAELARLEFRMKDVAYDLTTVKGMEVAKKDRAELRTLRTSLDRKRLELNEEDQARIKARNDEAKRLTKRISALEDPIDEQIKAEEARKETEKIERQRREAARVQALRTRIETMSGVAVRAVGKSSEYVREKIALVSAMTTDDFEEMTPVAVNTKADTLEKLNELLVAAEAHEKAIADLAEANARAAAQQAEAERLQREADARRLADERRQREEIEAQEEQQRAQRAAEAHRRQRNDFITGLVMSSVGEPSVKIRQHLRELEAYGAANNDDTIFFEAVHKLTLMATSAESTERMLAEQNRREAAERAEQERAEAAARQKRQNAMSEIEGIRQQVMIATLGRRGVREGGTLQCARDTLAETEAWPIDARFGDLVGVAQATKDAAVAAIKEIVAAGEERERQQAAEAQAAEQSRLAAEKTQRELQAQRDALDALQKAAPMMWHLLAETMLWLDKVTGKQAEAAQALRAKILTAVGSLEPPRRVDLPNGGYFAEDGTMMNADGTRSIFDDVDQ